MALPEAWFNIIYGAGQIFFRNLSATIEHIILLHKIEREKEVIIYDELKLT